MTWQVDLSNNVSSRARGVIRRAQDTMSLACHTKKDMSAIGSRTERLPACTCPSPSTLQHELDAVSQCSYSHMLFDTSVGRGFAVAQQRRDQSQLHGRRHVGAGKVLLRCCDDLFEAVQGRFQIARLEIGTRIAASLSNFDLILTIMHRGPSKRKWMMQVPVEPVVGYSSFQRTGATSAGLALASITVTATVWARSAATWAVARTYIRCYAGGSIGVEGRLIFRPTAAVSKTHRPGRR
jgi:hypothetical protein